MKKIKKILLAFCLIITMLLLSGCSEILQNLDNKELRNDTDVMLNAILMNDAEGAYPLVSDLCTKAEFAPIFNQMHELLDGVKEYELKVLSVNQSAKYDKGESLTTVDVVYEMTTNAQKFVVSVQSSSKVNGFSSFYITPYEKTSLHYVGTLDNMKGADATQWVLLASNIAVIGLMIWALIDCCRNKIKRKALWIILILLGAVSVGVTVAATSFNLNFNLVWFASYNALIRYGSGQTIFRLVVPVGAILYFVLKRKITDKSDNENTEVSEINE